MNRILTSPNISEISNIYMLSLILNYVITVKPLVQSPPKRPQFCKIHEGGGLDKGYKFYLYFLLKMCENIYVMMMTKM